MRLLQTYSGHPEGESIKVGFDGGIKLEFHGAKVSLSFINKRTACNMQHAMPTLPRQSIYNRLADYKNVNDPEQLSIDPVMRAKTEAKFVRHGRYVTFLMAEVAIDKRLFAEILSRIERLRCYSV